MNPFLLKLHWGDPKHPTEIRAWTGALGSRVEGIERPWQHCFVSHQIGRWYGISYERAGFVGLCVFGPSEDYRTTVAPRFGRGAELDTARPAPPSNRSEKGEGDAP
jgi:hypothetical protein